MLAVMTPPLSLVERKQRQAGQRSVEAARELFLERGFDGVSVGDIAERAEVGRTTFFRHFGDKQEVVFANEQELLDTITAARQADSTPAPRGATEAVEQLRPVVLALCAPATANPQARARPPRAGGRAGGGRAAPPGPPPPLPPGTRHPRALPPPLPAHRPAPGTAC